MRLEYDPVAEDFLLIDQGRVLYRQYIDPTIDSRDMAQALINRLRRPARSTDLARTSLDKPRPIEYDEDRVKRFKANGAPLLDLPDIELELEDLL